MKLLLHSPVGLLLAEYEPDVLRSLRFWRQGEHPPAGTRDAPARDDRLGSRLVEALQGYFAGERRPFELPLAPAQTPFQAAIREALCGIPFGEVRTYGEVARALGRPGASRAVGQANARNPFPIIVPCHRVVAAGGNLGGYMGEWGSGEALGTKRWLLEHEGVKEAGEPKSVGRSGKPEVGSQKPGEGGQRSRSGETDTDSGQIAMVFRARSSGS